MRQKSNILKFNFGPPTLVLQSVQIKVSIFVVDAQKSNLVVLENMLSGILLNHFHVGMFFCITYAVPHSSIDDVILLSITFQNYCEGIKWKIK